MNSEGEAPETQPAQGGSGVVGEPKGVGTEAAEAKAAEGVGGVDKGLVFGLAAVAVALVVIIVAIISALMTPDGGDAVAPDSSSDASSAASSAGTSLSDGTSSADAPLSASAASRALYDDVKYRDSHRNPSLHAIMELTGAELQDLLAECGFQWDSPISFWASTDGSLLGIQDPSGLLDRGQIDALPAGAAGQPVLFCLSVTGYGTPAEAFDALSADVEVDGSRSDDDAFFAVIHGSSAARCLLVATTTGEGEQMFLVFTDEAIASGLFASVIGIDAGSSIEEAWKALA